MRLQAGQRFTLSSVLGSSLNFDVRVKFNAPFDIDISIFGVNQNEKLFSDDYMVYFNQPNSPNNTISMVREQQGTTFKFDLNRHLEKAVEKFVICATVDSPNYTMKNIQSGELELLQHGNVLATFPITTELFVSEKAVMLSQIYFKNEWRFGAVGQGFNGGLPALVEHFGGEVANSPLQAPKQVQPPPMPTQSTINLSKIKLDKSNPSINLTKKSSGFGRISVNLNWNQKPANLVKSFMGAKPIDLDLCALIKYRNNNIYAIQALGNRFGEYERFPYLFLDGDDRAGTISSGENLYINGDKWDEIERIVIFAAIYDGAPSWSATDGVVTIKIPQQPEIEVRLSDGSNHRLCAILELKNDTGSIKANREVRYFDDLRKLDKHYRFGFEIVAGSKD